MRSVAVAAAATVLAVVVSASPVKPRELAQLYTSCSTPGVVAITFDDGPYIYEEDLLPLLANYSAKATFFLNGHNWACIYDDDRVKAVQDIYAAGHELGSHTWSHIDMAKTDWNTIHHEMYLIEQALVKIVGVMPALIRPPYGSYNSRALSAVAARNQSAVNWDLDSRDGLEATVEETKKIYDDAIAKQPKSILTLNHSVRKTTVKETIPYALEKLSAAGYRFVTVSECLGTAAYQFTQAAAARDATWKC